MLPFAICSNKRLLELYRCYLTSTALPMRTSPRWVPSVPHLQESSALERKDLLVTLSPLTAKLFALAHFWSPLVNLCLIPCIHVSSCSPQCNALFFPKCCPFFPECFLSPSRVFHLSLPICITHLCSLLFSASNLIPLVNFSVSLQIIKKRLCGIACKRKHCVPKIGYRLVCVSALCFGTFSFV